jgi:hypothetical protein
MNNPVYQHYIPKSYLKFFGQHKGKVVLVDTIMREETEMKILPTQAICAEKNIYTFDESQPGDPYGLEKFYANEVDAVYPKVYDMLVNSGTMNLTSAMKREILNTVLSLRFRRPEQLQQKIAKLEDMFRRMSNHPTAAEAEVHYTFNGKGNTFLYSDLETELENQRKKLKEDWLIGHFGQWQEFVNYKMICGLDVIEVPSDIPIVTSDNPVSLFDLQGKLITNNRLDPHSMMEIPLDRTHYLVILPNATSEKAYQLIHRSKRNKYFAAGVNNKTQENAGRRLIAFPGDLKIHFESQELINSDPVEGLKFLADSMSKVLEASELAKVIKDNGNSIFNQPVADKVRELRKSGAMEGDPLFERIIIELAKAGFFTV